MLTATCLIVGAHAQPPAASSTAKASAAAPPAGVLLGLNVGTTASVTAPESPPAFASTGDGYRTFWIVRDGDEAKVAASLPEIVVPHGSGFWQVGVTTVCEFDGASNGNRAVIWESPVGKAARVYQGNPCVRRKSVQTCNDVSARILFTSSSLVSEEYTQKQTEECEPRGGRWTTVDKVRKLGQSDPLDISEFLGQAIETAYWQALQEGLAELKRDGLNCPPPEKEQMNLTNWSVSRDRGSWHPVANGNGGLGECEIAEPMSAVIPRGATADTSSEQLFQSAKQSQPDLRDLMVSPNGDWAVAVFEKNGFQAFEVHAITARQLGRKLLSLDFTLPAGTNHVISAQWAVGNHVGEWSARLDAAARQGGVKPSIVVNPARMRNVSQEE
jgi:hypothetical protein